MYDNTISRHNNAWSCILMLIAARNTSESDARAISSPLTFADHLAIDISARGDRTSSTLIGHNPQ